jgi:hypothetical protein
MSGYGPPPMPPPPPPPFPVGGWQPPKPTSGKAIASLVCGLVALAGAFCYLPALAAPIGLVLGLLGIIETGREGARSGRGMAIAGTVISALGVLAIIGVIVAFVALARVSENQVQEGMAEELNAEQTELLESLKKYYTANDGSLGPGGPILATRREPGAPSRVHGTLTIDHLLDSSRSSRGAKWSLKVTGPASATLTCTRRGELLREVQISDIGKDQWIQTYP